VIVFSRSRILLQEFLAKIHAIVADCHIIGYYEFFDIVFVFVAETAMLV
jgi:hypothetical protein